MLASFSVPTGEKVVLEDIPCKECGLIFLLQRNSKYASKRCPLCRNRKIKDLIEEHDTYVDEINNTLMKGSDYWSTVSAIERIEDDLYFMYIVNLQRAYRKRKGLNIHKTQH